MTGDLDKLSQYRIKKKKKTILIIRDTIKNHSRGPTRELCISAENLRE